MGLRTLAKPGVVVVTAKKLDVVVALVEMKIEVAAALRAFQQTGEHAGFLGDCRALTPCAAFQLLHLFPSGPVNDGLMDIEKDRPVFLRIFNPLFYLVGFGVAFEVDNIAAVFLQGEDFLDGGVAPLCGLHGAF